ncbi:MAG: ABC transporter ATP-binding protein [Firmicutes bacterium]|nr:ABC transporter ATP-binding protein [Bacillota bacterium]
MTLLEAKDLKAYYITKSYGIERTVHAVDDISLDVNTDEILGIAGESGCGKSTLLRVMFGIIRPPLQLIHGTVAYRSGDRSLDLLSLTDDEYRQIRWKELSYIPQGSMSVLNPLRRVRKTFWDFIDTHRPNTTRREFEDLVTGHLSDLGLPAEVLDAFPHQLSGGMRQRVTIALATILKPRLIFADEPTTALDVIVQSGVIDLLRRIQAEARNSLVIVTHDMGIHANLADRIAIMYAGQIIEEAPAKQIFGNPQHPYTKYLIHSLPRIGDKSHRISSPGRPPSLMVPPKGCRFRDRCEQKRRICREERPLLVSIGENHKVACFLAVKEGAHAS